MVQIPRRFATDETVEQDPAGVMADRAIQFYDNRCAPDDHANRPRRYAFLRAHAAEKTWM
jgi:hypothetical protein